MTDAENTNIAAAELVRSDAFSVTLDTSMDVRDGEWDGQRSREELRLWATREGLAPLAAKELAARTDGDGTARSPIFDILRRKDWPAEYDFRALRNALHREWEGREAELRADPGAARAAFEAAAAAGDFTGANVTVGEATGLIHDIPGAGEVLRRIANEAEARLGGAGDLIQP